MSDIPKNRIRIQGSTEHLIADRIRDTAGKNSYNRLCVATNVYQNNCLARLRYALPVMILFFYLMFPAATCLTWNCLSEILGSTAPNY